jgi:hypothetical protein
MVNRWSANQYAVYFYTLHFYNLFNEVKSKVRFFHMRFLREQESRVYGIPFFLR